ncbi:MAG: response regulator [candidate division Zixibacteria bacterium]|nr:response regulator [candidate division Zixibacteria bacterium]
MLGSNGTNIVVVDDEKYICNIIHETLTSEKYNVKIFSDPVEALEYIKENPVDLVLTDLIMGEYSGTQILEEALEHHNDAIVILMTAYPDVHTAISVLTKGAYDFLVKPFRLELLKTTIKRGLKHQNIIRDNLRLRGQIEFLKVASATSAEVDTEEFLKLVASSCMKEMSATAVGIIETDPETREPVLKVHESEIDPLKAGILDAASLEKFIYTKSRQSIIQTEQVEKGKDSLTEVFISQPIYARRRLHGVINVLIRTRFDEVTLGQLDALAILANSTAAILANQQLYLDLRKSYFQAISALANAIEARDASTAGHTDRVGQLSQLLAHQLGWDESRIDDLIMGCTLHDIGKIGVPDAILTKPGKLTKAERTKMEAHPEVGVMIIDGIELFRPAVPYIISHHEFFDGSGYPNGLSGEDIPIEGRLLAVVDTFEAILSNRPYRKGSNIKVAVLELIRCKGTQFDPEIVDTFVDVIRQGKVDFNKLYNREENLAQLSDIPITEKASV